jgi:steroid 5-alpha reductase family enzyme
MWAEFALVLAVNAGVLLACMLLLWLLSIPLMDASIVDIFWGPGFAVAAWVTFAFAGGAPARKWLIAVLTTLWALRLGLFLLWRKRGEGEDRRYTALINHLGAERRHRITLTKVFLTQGVVMWLVAFPVMAAQLWREPATPGIPAYLGAAFWLVGFLFESIGDWQMARFKADPGNRGKVMERGLWRYTRHPNYFGDACVWFGLWLIACDDAWGLATVFAPILMTYFLVAVSGKALLERRMTRKNPAYADYVARTSGFVPWPPRPGAR